MERQRKDGTTNMKSPFVSVLEDTGPVCQKWLMHLHRFTTSISMVPPLPRPHWSWTGIRFIRHVRMLPLCDISIGKSYCGGSPSCSGGLGGEGASWPLEDKPDRSDRACDRCFSTTIYLISLTRGDRLQDASKLEQIRSREPWFLQAQRTRLTVLDDFSDWILSRLETLDFRPLKIHLQYYIHQQYE